MISSFCPLQRPRQPDRLNPQSVGKIALFYGCSHITSLSEKEWRTETARQKWEKIQSHQSWGNTRKAIWMTKKLWDAFGADHCSLWHIFLLYIQAKLTQFVSCLGTPWSTQTRAVRRGCGRRNLGLLLRLLPPTTCWWVIGCLDFFYKFCMSIINMGQRLT